MPIALQPTGDQIRAFRDRGTGAPIYMLNLLKFKEKAVYEDGRKTDLSGPEAYALYGKRMGELVEAEGGSVVYGGPVVGMLIGEMDQDWDSVGIVHYPSTEVMLKILRLPEYAEISKHREAGLEGQLLIECGKGTGLGW